MTYLTRLTTCCWLLWSLAGLSVARAQDYSDIGLKPHAAYSDSNIDHIDLATGNVVGTIPIVSYPQLGHLPPLTFSVIFNTSPWHIEETCDTYGDQCVAYYVADQPNSIYASALGANMQSNLNGLRLNIDAFISYRDVCTNPYWPYLCESFADTYYAERDISLTDETGATHSMYYDTNNPNWAHAADGSGYSLYAIGANDPWNTQNWFSQLSGTFYSPTGNTFQGLNAINSGAAMAESDPAGNSESVYFTEEESPHHYIDSIGRQIPDPAAGPSNAPTSSCPNVGDPNQPVAWASQWNAPGPNGGTTQYILCYTGFTIQPHLFSDNLIGPDCDTSWLSDEGSTNTFTLSSSTYGYLTYAIVCNQSLGIYPLQSIVLPDGTAWSFLYDAGSPYTSNGENYYTESYGTVKEIRLPTGGKIQYTYQNRYNDLNSEMYYKNARVVTSRTEVDTTGSTRTKAFVYDNYPPNATITTETTSDGNTVVHTFVPDKYTELNPVTGGGTLNETKAQYYQGTASGTPLREVDTTYVVNYMTSTNGNISPLRIQALPNTVTAMTPAGVLSTVQDNYTSPYTLASYTCAVDFYTITSATTNYGEQCYISGSGVVDLDQATEEDLYDGSSNLLRSTVHTPKYTQSSTYKNANQLNLIASDQIFDGSGNLAAQTTYGYDESGYGPICSSGPCGNQTSVSHWLNTTDQNIASHIAYNSYGMPVTVTDPLGNSTTTTYDSTHLFPSAVQHSSLVDYYNYDANTTNLNWHTDQNGSSTGDAAHTTHYFYDVMGRLAKVVGPPTQNGSSETDYCYTDIGGATCPATSPPFSVYATTIAAPNPGQTSVQTYDGLGRPVRSVAASGAITDTNYDVNGRVYSVSNPYYSTGDPTYGLTYFTYDALGRKISQTQPDGHTQTWAYSGNTVTFTDENLNQWQRTSDALGRLITVLEPNGTNKSPTMETDYSYDALSNLLSVRQWGGSYGSSGAVSRSFTYDSLSRLLTAANPETGTVSYTYDADGNVHTKTDARSVITTYQYDALNRLLSKTYSDGATPSSCYQYDSSSVMNGVGRLTSLWTQKASAGACSTAAAFWTKRSILAYDAMGRILNEQQCTPSNCTNGTPYSPVYTYDLAGNPLTSTSGVGQTQAPISFTNTFDCAGRLQTMISSWTGANSAFPATLFSTQAATCSGSSSSSYAAFGGLTNAAFGNGLTLSRAYDKRLRITNETDNRSIVTTTTPGSATVTITGSEQSK